MRPAVARHRMWALTILASAVTLLAGCGDGGSVEPIDPPGSLSIQPASQTMEVGGTVTLTVSADGSTVPADELFWSSNDTDVASVTESGQVTAKSPGTARISASKAGRSASSQITVQTKAVRNVSISPLAGSVQVGGTLQLTATLTAADGTELSGREIEWSSANTDVATISSSGMVSGKAAGVSVIRATSEGVTGQAQVTVAAPVDRVVITPSSVTLNVGDNRQFSAIAYDANDNVLSGRVAAWHINPQSVATITSGGRVTAVGAGTAEITATIEGKQANASVTVRPPPVASVDVTPGEVELKLGATQQFQAIARDAGGNVLDDRAVTWSVAPSALASITGSGLLTANLPGSVTVTATVEGVAGTAKVTVLPPVVARVAVSAPNNSPMSSNQTRQLTAIAYDEDDRVIQGVDFAWSSSQSDVAAVNQSGLVSTPLVWSGRHDVVITATADGKSGTITITVRGVFGGDDDDDDDGP